MKMIKTVLLASILTVGIGAVPVFAGCVGAVVNGKCIGNEVYGVAGSGSSSESDSNNYKGSSGSTYQYNLNNPVDRNKYSIDLDAQRRDQMSVNPGRTLDRGIGQYGGGIKNDR
jgi:hypothetical protein